MKEPSFYIPFAKELGICILIPTYNNAATLAEVVQGALQYCADVIVVNDGSTDGTAPVLASFPQIQLVDYQPNKGKGWALRQGFKAAAARGFRYAISIDSDGQHFAKDLPVLMEKIKECPDSLLIGARNMNQDSVPGKSSFGNKFSNFWFRLFTGIKAADTQSGYRLYPLAKLANMHFFTRKFEFEIEVIVRAAWAGVDVLWVPVTVYYPPPGERVSHFRPFKDFTRISLLNTCLCLIALLYIKPRDFIKGIFDKKKRRAFYEKYILRPDESKKVKAFSIAFGIFMGIIPIWGFQLAAAIPLAIFMRLNRALVILAANISIPPMIPIIIYFSHKVGAFWMHDPTPPLTYNTKITFQSIGQNFWQYFVGSITLAVGAGLAAGLISFAVMSIMRYKPKTKPVKA